MGSSDDVSDVFSPQAVLVFSDATHFLTELYPSFCSLCCDPEVSVRKSAAACFHQVSCQCFEFWFQSASRH